MHSPKQYQGFKKTVKQLWVVGVFVKHVFPFVITGALGKGEMRGGRSICVMIDQRALEDFITFYIYSCLYTLDSDETRMSELLSHPEAVRSESCFVAIVSGGRIVDAACAMPRVCFSGRDCTKGEGDIMGRIATIWDGVLMFKTVLYR